MRELSELSLLLHRFLIILLFPRGIEEVCLRTRSQHRKVTPVALTVCVVDHARLEIDRDLSAFAPNVRILILPYGKALFLCAPRPSRRTGRRSFGYIALLPEARYAGIFFSGHGAHKVALTSIATREMYWREAMQQNIKFRYDPSTLEMNIFVSVQPGPSHIWSSPN